MANLFEFLHLFLIEHGEDIACCSLSFLLLIFLVEEAKAGEHGTFAFGVVEDEEKTTNADREIIVGHHRWNSYRVCVCVSVMRRPREERRCGVGEGGFQTIQTYVVFLE